MITAKAYAAQSAKLPLGPWAFERREVGPHDVQIEILYCGVCHTDIHQTRDEWGGATFPMVPGHEIVGKVVKVGDHVKNFKPGDLAGVGVIVDSCEECVNCKNDIEQYCKEGAIFTYGSIERDGSGLTYGGYSNTIVTKDHFVLHVSEKLQLHAVAPLLCAGITTYAPLRYWKVGKGHKVAVLGIGGLGHMAVKFAASFGAEVTVLSTSPHKEADAKKLGANKFILTTNKEQVDAVTNYFDFIVDAVAAPHDYNMYLNMLNTDGTIMVVGIPPEAAQVQIGALIGNRRKFSGSMIGGIKETQEMLDYCAEHSIVSEVEVIPIQNINEAYERMIKNDVRYRFVIDMKSLA
jgi:alcohol dehydrogenase (NADP+)